jgi:hypothetical protein
MTESQQIVRLSIGRLIDCVEAGNLFRYFKVRSSTTLSDKYDRTEAIKALVL